MQTKAYRNIYMLALKEQDTHKDTETDTERHIEKQIYTQKTETGRHADTKIHRMTDRGTTRDAETEPGRQQKYEEIDRQTSSDIDRETGREAGRMAGRKIYRHTHTDT